MDDSEYARVMDFLASMPGLAHSTMETKDYRALLLRCGGQVMLNGRLYDVVGKNLGAGVYKVTTRKAS